MIFWIAHNIRLLRYLKIFRHFFCALCELTIWPALLNSLSDGELLAEIAKYLWASWLKSRNFLMWHFHQSNRSSSPSIIGILVYSSISFFNLLWGVWGVVEVICDICPMLVVHIVCLHKHQTVCSHLAGYLPHHQACSRYHWISQWINQSNKKNSTNSIKF